MKYVKVAIFIKKVRPNILDFPRNELLDHYEIEKYSGFIRIFTYKFHVIFLFNTVLQKVRILIETENLKVKIHQESYKKEFKFIKSLQKQEFCSKTILKSLELYWFLKKVLFT